MHHRNGSLLVIPHPAEFVLGNIIINLDISIVYQHWADTGSWILPCGRPGPIFCLLVGVSSDYAQPITGQVTKVTCPVIGRAQPELTPSKRQKMGPEPHLSSIFKDKGWWAGDARNQGISIHGTTGDTRSQGISIHGTTGDTRSQGISRQDIDLVIHVYSADAGDRIFRLCGQYHACWCTGSLCHQVICSHGIDHLGRKVLGLHKDGFQQCHLSVAKWHKNANNIFTFS